MVSMFLPVNRVEILTPKAGGQYESAGSLGALAS